MEELFEKLPQKFIDRLKNQLNDEQFEKFKNSLKNIPARGLRVNKNRTIVDEFLKNSKLKLKKLDFCDDGFLLENEEKLGNSSEHLSGVYYLQEPSSMLAVCASEIENEQRPLKVLDLCASPGGKTSQIATRISKNSILFSNEIIKSRAQVLFSNIERQGFENVVVLNEDPKNLLCFEGYFDYVFVDAPCSGEGMFRKNTETIGEWSEENVIMCAKRQKEILESAIKLVAYDGKLIYSTCTYSIEEDEYILEWLINEKGFELLNIDETIKSITLPSTANVKNADYARKAYPFSIKGEGQFIAVLKNNIKNDFNYSQKKKHFETINEVGNSDFKFIKEFFDKNLSIEIEKRLLKVGDNIYLPPIAFGNLERSLLDKLRFITLGIKIGKVEKDRFEPNHHLFMAFDKLFNTKIELDDLQLSKYLHGEELMTDIIQKNKANYVVLTKNKQPIGGGKLVGNRIKNLYPKGMRI